MLVHLSLLIFHLEDSKLACLVLDQVRSWPRHDLGPHIRHNRVDVEVLLEIRQESF